MVLATPFPGVHKLKRFVLSLLFIFCLRPRTCIRHTIVFITDFGRHYQINDLTAGTEAEECEASFHSVVQLGSDRNSR